MAPIILIVDDEPDLELLIRQRFRRQIRAGAYHFAFARNGQEALSCIATERPDLVLMDVEMPELGGLEALRRLRSDPATVNASTISDPCGSTRTGAPSRYRGPVRRDVSRPPE